MPHHNLCSLQLFSHSSKGTLNMHACSPLPRLSACATTSPSLSYASPSFPLPLPLPFHGVTAYAAGSRLGRAALSGVCWAQGDAQDSNQPGHRDFFPLKLAGGRRVAGRSGYGAARVLRPRSSHGVCLASRQRAHDLLVIGEVGLM